VGRGCPLGAVAIEEGKVSQSQGFRGDDWFLHIARNRMEGPCLDFKRGLLKLYADDEFLDRWKLSQKKGNTVKKSEAARDIIAFANVARRIRKPCYIFFGVPDKRETGFALLDIRDEYPIRVKPSVQSQVDKFDLPRKQEEVATQYYNLARDWIEPRPELRYEFGVIGGEVVAYLKILPTRSCQPYRLKRDAPDKKGKIYPAGTVFIRFGSSTVEVSPDEVDNLVPFDDVPYLEEKEWKKTISPLQRGTFENAHFLVRDFPLLAEETGQDALYDVLDKLQEGVKRIVVTGFAGAGKSVLLHALGYELAKMHNLDDLTFRRYFAEAVSGGRFSSVEDLEVVPRHPVPIFVHLRGRFETLDIFKRNVLESMALEDRIGRYDLDAFFRIPGTRWVLLLDALDEVHNLNEFGPGLEKWLVTLPDNVQVVLSSRPVVEHKADIVVKLQMLDDEIVKELLRVKFNSLVGEGKLDALYADDKLAEAITLMGEFPEIGDVLYSPRAVDGFIKFLVQIDPTLDLDEEPVEDVFREDDTPPREKNSNDKRVPIETTIALPVISEDEVVSESERDVLDVQESNEKDGVSFRDDNDNVDVVPSFVTVFSGIIEHVRDKEKERQKSWGLSPIESQEEAKNSLEELAWEKNWNTERFTWKGKWRRILSEKSIRWNEYIGFVRRVGFERYRYLSLFFQSFCAANYGAMGLLEEYLDKQTVVETIEGKQNHSSTQQVIDLLNRILQDNGKEPLFTNEEV
jgi:hypothetical protein